MVWWFSSTGLDYWIFNFFFIHLEDDGYRSNSIPRIFCIAIWYGWLHGFGLLIKSFELVKKWVLCEVDLIFRVWMRLNYVPYNCRVNCTNYECKSTRSTHNFSGFHYFLILLEVSTGKLFESLELYMRNSLQITVIRILKVYEASMTNMSE